jgi:amino acid adenylation domain-containing protein
MADTSTVPEGLHAGFFAAAERFGDRPALYVQGRTLTYAEMRCLVLTVAHALAQSAGTANPMVGILAHRSLEVYAGILGALACGGTVVPLNPGFPVSRTRQMIELAGVHALVVDCAGQALLPELLAGCTKPVLILTMAAPSAESMASDPPVVRRAVTSADPGGFEARSSATDDLAYLFFTSGSTGAPKGVGVLHRNAKRFVEMSAERYAELPLGSADRFSQFYDITFDSSLFDLFVSWHFGGCLCVPSAGEWINPNKFILAQSLTVIDIVPSMGHGMTRGNGWRAGRFPGLRLCRFGGEALSADLAATLAEAAPNAVIDNVYGPTECTVDAAYYRWDRERSPAECLHGVVPIGTAGPRVGLRVVDSQLQEMPIGGEGELLISGPQVTPGYWQDPQRTANSFIEVPGSAAVHYRTGDLVRRVPEGQPIPYLGRMDYQIKIAGVRIELGEVEHELRQVSGTDLAVAVGWPRTKSGASGIVAFVAKPGADGVQIREALKKRLPSVMVPSAVHVLDELPLNVNSKVDRKALLERLQSPVNPA